MSKPDRWRQVVLLLTLGFGPAAMPADHALAQDAPGTVDLLAGTPVSAEPMWGAAVFMGFSGGGHDLHELALRPWLADPGDYRWYGAAVSRRLLRFSEGFTIEAEAGVGRRVGSPYQATEGWVAGYLRWDVFPWNRFIRTSIAASTGLDLIDHLPPEETRKEDRHHSFILHYFSPELSFALPQFPNSELVVRYHHRSGVFGTFNGVWGGSNVISAGYRHRW